MAYFIGNPSASKICFHFTPGNAQMGNCGWEWYFLSGMQNDGERQSSSATCCIIPNRMDSVNAGNQKKRREEWLWLLPPLVLLLILGCLALTTGVSVDGAKFRLESSVTNYPFCPPEIPCPISVVLDEKHFVVWQIWETKSQGGIETAFRKWIDIRLP